MNETIEELMRRNPYFSDSTYKIKAINNMFESRPLTTEEKIMHANAIKKLSTVKRKLYTIRD